MCYHQAVYSHSSVGGCSHTACGHVYIIRSVDWTDITASPLTPMACSKDLPADFLINTNLNCLGNCSVNSTHLELSIDVLHQCK